MKALILDGSGARDEAALTARESLQAQLKAAGWTVESVTLRDKRIAGCTSCFGCWLKTPGICVVDDDARDVAKSFIQSDLAVFLTPVTFGGYSSELKKAVDRLLPNIMPYLGRFHGELHHTKRYDRYPSLISIGTLPFKDREAERIFKALLDREARNFHSPWHASGVVVQGQPADAAALEVKRLLKLTGVPA